MRKFLLFLIAFVCLHGLVWAQGKGIEFRLICTSEMIKCDKVYDPNAKTEISVDTNVVLSNQDIEKAEVKEVDLLATYHKSKGIPLRLEPRLYIYFTKQGKEKLLKITSENVNKRLAVFLDSEFLLAPTIAEPVKLGQLELNGLTKEKAEKIAAQVNAQK